MIQCSNVVPDKSGKKIVASLQYENIVLLGSNCGIGDLDDIAELNNLCNQVGVDAIETGAAIGVAMEAGVIKFGDAAGAKDLIRQIGQGTYLGRIIGHGAALAGRVLGVRRIPALKGQAMPAYDPRALKGIGVTYATSPMGADHTAGNAFETLKTLNPLGTEKQVETSRRLQIRAAILDTLEDVKAERRDPPRASWILVSEKTVGAQNLAMGVNETFPGGMVPEHKHELEEEVMFFLEGKGKFITED